MLQPPITPNEPPLLHLLDEGVFESLCRDLMDEEPEISVCEVYGVRGQSQYRIDLIAHCNNGYIGSGFLGHENEVKDVAKEVGFLTQASVKGDAGKS